MPRNQLRAFIRPGTRYCHGKGAQNQCDDGRLRVCLGTVSTACTLFDSFGNHAREEM